MQVLKALEAVIDPDFAMNIVDCGFVKDLAVDGSAGSVAFRLELTTPACPIKEEFERDATAVVQALPWVNTVRPPPAPRCVFHPLCHDAGIHTRCVVPHFYVCINGMCMHSSVGSQQTLRGPGQVGLERAPSFLSRAGG